MIMIQGRTGSWQSLSSQAAEVHGGDAAATNETAWRLVRLIIEEEFAFRLAFENCQLLLLGLWMSQ